MRHYICNATENLTSDPKIRINGRYSKLVSSEIFRLEIRNGDGATIANRTSRMSHDPTENLRTLNSDLRISFETNFK